MKKEYIKPEFEKIGIVSDNMVLIGSVTSVNVEIQDVKVKEFQDGFEKEGGFKEVDFD